MKMLMEFRDPYLYPSSDDSIESYGKLKNGQGYTVEVKEARNPKFHRLAFGLIKAMFENQEQYGDFDAFRRTLKLMTGSYNEFVAYDGKTLYEPHSWSFADMDDIEFHEIFNKLLSIAAKRYGDDFADRYA